MNLPELKMIMKENKIAGSSHMNKPEISAVLLNRGIISTDSVKKQAPQVKREFDPKYEFIKSIRNNPKNVEIRDLATGEVTQYSSIYKASRALSSSSSIIIKNNGKVWHGYFIRIL
jgi:hypothetical protein